MYLFSIHEKTEKNCFTSKTFFETSNDKRAASLKITKNWVISAVSRPKNIKTLFTLA